jgi:3',5'-cyclic AMP phosphodiesterase CpdA
MLWMVLSAMAIVAGCAGQTQSVRLAVVADIQYADRESAGERHFRQSLGGLEQFVLAANAQKPDFAIELGDIIDGGPDAMRELDRILEIYHRLDCPKYYVLGNHEFNGLAREVVLAKLKLKKGYYVFDRGGFRFVVLDTVELSENSDAATEQLNWLDQQLADAAKRKKNTVVFGHYPPLPEANSYLAGNAHAVCERLEKYGCVRAYLCGHIHAGGYLEQNGVHYLTLPAMVDTPDGKTWAMMTLYPDRLDIQGTGKIKNKTLIFQTKY